MSHTPIAPDGFYKWTQEYKTDFEAIDAGTLGSGHIRNLLAKCWAAGAEAQRAHYRKMSNLQKEIAAQQVKHELEGPDRILKAAQDAHLFSQLLGMIEILSRQVEELQQAGGMLPTPTVAAMPPEVRRQAEGQLQDLIKTKQAAASQEHYEKLVQQLKAENAASKKQMWEAVQEQLQELKVEFHQQFEAFAKSKKPKARTVKRTR